MKPPLFLFLCLIAGGCATKLETREARILDRKSHPVSSAQVIVRGDAPKHFPFGIAMGRIYTETTTNDDGIFTLTTPVNKRWYMDVSRDLTKFRTEAIESQEHPVTFLAVPVILTDTGEWRETIQ